MRPGLRHDAFVAAPTDGSENRGPTGPRARNTQAVKTRRITQAAAATLLSLASCVNNADPASSPSIASPDGQTVVTVAMDPTALAPGLVVRRRERELVRVDHLGWRVAGAPAGPLTLVRSERTEHRATFEHRLGQQREILDHHLELRLDLQDRVGGRHTLSVRAHDDGVAWRWRFPAPPAAPPTIEAELARHTLAGNPRAFPGYREHFRTSHEGPYSRHRLAELTPQTLIDLPLVFAHDDGTCLAFTEASVRDFPHAYLRRESVDATTLTVAHAPLPAAPSCIASGEGARTTPWRVWLLGDSITTLLESDLLLTLCEPTDLTDTAWIVPGKQTWHWWNGTVLDDRRAGGMDYETMRAYIDFCAESGIRYHAITGQAVPWYVQSRQSVLPSDDADVLTPRPELRWPELLAHARDRAVDLRLWVHWQPLAKQLDAAFALYERWGIRGVMVDFLDRDDQEMVRFADRVLAAAARHRLTVQFHGSFKPSGLERTWPHLVNHEGSANLEVLKWSAACDPDHDLIVPFTRGLAGPLDYHLGGFRATTRDGFAPHYLRPVVLGTRARALANYVVLFNPLPMVADHPAAYAGQAGFAFVRDVPTTWDESVVVSAAIGEHLAWARRSGDRWYLGAITNWTPRDLALPLKFLGDGEHHLHLWRDAIDANADPNTLVEDVRTVRATDTLHVQLAAGGGMVAVVD